MSVSIVPLPDTPALAKQLSTRPSAATDAAKAASTCASSPTSHTKACTRAASPHSSASEALARAVLSALDPQMATAAPLASSARAMP